MRFHARNLFYLRLSASDIIPLYLYLDERHIDWMSERTLQSVVADLRTLVGPKLEAERHAHYGPGGPANAKKGTVGVHRGDTYQFACFLRKAEPHSIVLKTRNYVMVHGPTRKQDAASKEAKRVLANSSKDDVQTGDSAKGTKRLRKTTQKKSVNRKGKERAKTTDIIDLSEGEAEESSVSDSEENWGQDGDETIVPRRSLRNKKQRTVYHVDSDDDEDIAMQEDDQEVQVKDEVNDSAPLVAGDGTNEEEPDREPSSPPVFDIDEDEEKKLKPELQLSFRSLNMQDRCLCVVVEPWPVLSSRPTPFTDHLGNSRTASLAPFIQRPGQYKAPSITPSRFSADPEGQARREQTPMPLFLPDPSGRDRSVTPAPALRFSSELASLEIIDTDVEVIEDDDDFGMLAFSQMLNNVPGDRTGAAEDDDEMDGGALYGDADEMRGDIQ